MMAATGRFRMGTMIGLLVATIIVSSGCNRGPKCYPVTGKVTWQGEPVPLGNVTFVPVAGGRPARGTIGNDGTYELTTYESGDGAQAGEYQVAIESIEYPQSNQPLPKTLADEANVDITLRKPPRRLIPDIFSSPEKSKLTATIDSDTDTINFDLPPK